MSKALTAEVARIRALVRMAREESVEEMAVGEVSFKLAPVPQQKDEEPAVEEIEPVEAVARGMEEDMGIPVDRQALREYLGNVPAKKARA